MLVVALAWGKKIWKENKKIWCVCVVRISLVFQGGFSVIKDKKILGAVIIIRIVGEGAYLGGYDHQDITTINRDQYERNIITVVYSRNIISMRKYSNRVCKMIIFVINNILIFLGGFNMNKDKNIFVTIIIRNRSTIITRVEDIRSIVKGVGKVEGVVEGDVFFMGF